MSRNKEMMSFGNPSNVGAGKVSIDDSDSEVENEEVENEGNKAEKQTPIGTWGKQAAASPKKKLAPISFSDIEKLETAHSTDDGESSQKQSTTDRTRRYQQPASGDHEQGQRAGYDFQKDDGYSTQPKNFFGTRQQDSSYQRRNFNDSYQDETQDSNNNNNYNNYPKSFSRDFADGGQGGFRRGGGQRRNQYYDNSNDNSSGNGRNYNDGGRGQSNYEQTKISFGKQQQVAPGQQPHVDEFKVDDESNDNGGFGNFRGQGRREQGERKPQFQLGNRRDQPQMAGGRNEGNVPSSSSYSNDQTTGPRRTQSGGFGFGSKQQQPKLETTEWRPSD